MLSFHFVVLMLVNVDSISASLGELSMSADTSSGHAASSIAVCIVMA